MRTFISLLFALLLTTSLYSQSGKTLALNGTTQYMRIANHADFDIAQNESFTLTAWIKVNSYESEVSNAQRFISKRCMEGVSGLNTSGYELWGALNGNASSGFFANNAPGPNGTNHTNSMSSWSTSGGNLATWFHVAFVVDRTAGKMYLYHNGTQVASSGSKDISPWYVDNDFDVYVGAGLRNASTVSYFFDGEFDNVRFYKRALTSTEINTDKNSNSISSATTGLVAAYDFESTSGTTVPDISGNGHNGELVGFSSSGSGSIGSVTLLGDTNFTGRGNISEPIVRAQISASSVSQLNSVVVSMDGTTDISDVTAIKIYSTGTTELFNPKKTSQYTLLGQTTPTDGDITIPLSGTLPSGSSYLWVTYDISEGATEGNIVDASVKAINYSGNNTYTLPTSVSDGAREILLKRVLVYSPGDYSSKNYRIPALVTAQDGSLVIATDKRKNNQGDLPEDIDVLINRSVDGGKTWSQPITIAQGTGYGQGYGDAGLARTAEDGGLICVFVGGKGFFGGTPSAPNRTYICKSTDNGVTWTAPKDITPQLFGAECSDPVRRNWHASFCASGTGLLTRDGTICFVAAVRETSDENVASVSNYVYYSEDNGTTWKVSTVCKPNNGNEAKIVELNDGSWLVSIRNQSKGSRYYTISKDRGQTWSEIALWNEMYEPGCNGDLIRYTSTVDGYDRNRLLHTVPFDAVSRKNMSMFISYDEGDTWSVNKTICPGNGAYSSIAILPDGTIGVYTEEDYMTSDMSTFFLNFSLDWLTDGADTYTVPDGSAQTDKPIFTTESGTTFQEESAVIKFNSVQRGTKIYYTLDGSIPTTESAQYTSAGITITESTTIKAMAKASSKRASDIVTARYYFPDYCKDENNSARTDRYLSSVQFSGTEVPFNSGTLETGGHQVYSNHTDKVIVARPGATITPSLSWNGLWMHGYLHIDYNCDKEFDQTLNANGTTGGEVVSYNYYEGRNSLGSSTSSGPDFGSLPAFTLPYNIAEGDYRLRVKIDWNSLDACGNPTQSIAGNGGSQVDFTLRITYPSSVEEADNDNVKIFVADGAVNIVGYIGDVKIVNTTGQIVKDMTITDGDNIELNRGIYIVVLNGKREKVIIE
ncbi:MAG: exo-alpha-sialidase [Bacteroidales bacterium]|nr:exo-alpha-sialidase [Bacteroidales bacterium]